MVKHDSSLLPTSAKTGSMPLLVPMMADASSMTQRYSVMKLLSIFENFQCFFQDVLHASFLLLYLFLAFEVPHSDSCEVHERQEQSWTQDHWHRTFTWGEQGDVSFY